MSAASLSQQHVAIVLADDDDYLSREPQMRHTIIDTNGNIVCRTIIKCVQYHLTPAQH
jgi:hypothetical protein